MKRDPKRIQEIGPQGCDAATKKGLFPCMMGYCYIVCECPHNCASDSGINIILVFCRKGFPSLNPKASFYPNTQSNLGEGSEKVIKRDLDPCLRIYLTWHLKQIQGMPWENIGFRDKETANRILNACTRQACPGTFNKKNIGISRRTSH